MEEYSELLFGKIQDSFFSGIMPQIPAFVLKAIEETLMAAFSQSQE